MDGIKLMAIVGLIGLLITIPIFIIGVILLIKSILKTIKHEKRIGGIVTGAILTIVGFSLGLYISVLFLIGGYGASFASSKTSNNYETYIKASLEDEDSDDLYDLFAKESYSGDELTYEDAAEICGLIENTKFKSIKAIGTAWHNDVKSVSYVCHLTDKDSGSKISADVIVITNANHKDFRGIQYLKLTIDDEDYTYGTKPKLN